MHINQSYHHRFEIIWRIMIFRKIYVLLYTTNICGTGFIVWKGKGCLRKGGFTALLRMLWILILLCWMKRAFAVDLWWNEGSSRYKFRRTVRKTLSWWQSPVSFNNFSNLSLFSMDVFFSSAITAPPFDALALFFTFFNKIFLWISFRKSSSFQSPSFLSFLF